MIGKQDKCLLRLQKALSFCIFPFIFFLVWCWLRFIRAYRINNVAALRQQYLAIIKNSPGPILLCPNHLTFIDSLILISALCKPWRYFLCFRHFPWNLPKEENVEVSKLYRFVCYISKCLYIPKDKTKTKHVMDKVQWLMQGKQDFIIFPEGTRSNTGRINTTNFIYGVGQLILDAPGITVISVYLRGRQQTKRSVLPKRGDNFDIALEKITPHTDKKGLRAMRDVASQLINHLVTMEDDYFTKHTKEK